MVCVPFPLHFQMRMERQQKSKQEKHPFGDMIMVSADRSLPDLWNIIWSRFKYTLSYFQHPVFYIKYLYLHTCRIEKTKCIRLSSDHYGYSIVVKHLQELTNIVSLHLNGILFHRLHLLIIFLIRTNCTYRWNIFRWKFICCIRDQ